MIRTRQHSVDEDEGIHHLLTSGHKATDDQVHASTPTPLAVPPHLTTTPPHPHLSIRQPILARVTI
jgi:hypothetical protein